jgi:hypothetical protein
VRATAVEFLFKSSLCIQSSSNTSERISQWHERRFESAINPVKRLPKVKGRPYVSPSLTRGKAYGNSISQMQKRRGLAEGQWRGADASQRLSRRSSARRVKGNYTRFLFDPLKYYLGVLMQQGNVGGEDCGPGVR